jgi:hypothetical protein
MRPGASSNLVSCSTKSLPPQALSYRGNFVCESDNFACPPLALGNPSVDSIQRSELLFIGPVYGVHERIVLVGDHPSRRVTKLSSDEFGVPVAHQSRTDEGPA